jgi:predicted ATPase
MLGTLNAKIYDLDSFDVEERPWTKLENVRYLYEFFRANEGLFG